MMSRTASGSLALVVVFTVAIGFIRLNDSIGDVDARVLVNQENEYPCEEIYIVKEGETLQTISEKCNAPFILMENTHIQDTDDLSQGLVLKITSLDRQRWRN
eukprot:Gb_39268 [translate_table: standard]